ncbi:MFS transporter [Gordonia sp. TBRC 11910]|uniref:MFS transporter n=1 Tax=Gordonia asplenii TaxID=2725283 RepID=A0A848KM17_9ACTN|nr:MFS transporter [Gordonia asplenii]NMO00134.1 MFS transporter [Gordonia asplenii]
MITRPLSRRRPDRPASPEVFDRRLLTPMLAATVLNPINSAIIAVSLIPIARAFGVPLAHAQWLVSGLYLATAVGQPVVGRIVDLFGPRKPYLVLTGLVGVAGVLGMLAPNLDVLIAARILLGVGTCAGFPVSMYLIRSEARRTGKDSPAVVLTALSVCAQAVAALGPSLGGGLILLGGWRASFAVNIPLALFCLYFGARRLPTVRGDATIRAIDWPGVVLFGGALSAALLYLMNPQLSQAYLLAVAVVLAVVLVVVERRRDDPFLDLRVLSGNRPLMATYTRNMVAYIVSYSFLYGLAQWMQDGRGLSPSAAGLLQLPLATASIVVASLTGRSPRIWGKLVVGAAFQVIAAGLLLTLHSASGVGLLVVVAVCAGIPQGLNGLGNQNAVYSQADPARIAASAGLLRTSMYVGAMTSSVVLAQVFGADATTGGLHRLAYVLLVVAGLGVLMVVGDRSLRRIGSG